MGLFKDPTELKRYAELLVRLGVNVQPGQTLNVRAPIEAAPLVHKVVEVAYQAGARHVVIDWNDEEVNRLSIQHASEESLELVEEGQIRDLTARLENGGAVLTIVAPNPEHFKGVDSRRMGIFMKATREATRRVSELVQGSHISWAISTIPTPAWAELVFPDLSAEEAYEKLWACIKIATRLDQEDPVAFWQEHVSRLEARMKELTERQFVRLHYKAPGTDLTVEMPKNHKWVGGSLRNNAGTQFFPNLPTEEVFSAPLKTGVNGVLSGTRPLSRNGQYIDGIKLTIKDGRIVEAKAEVGEDVLNQLLDMDEGARYLGEVALVPEDSTISNLNVIFHQTLFDENASCHFAFGSAYPLCVEGGAQMSKEEYEQTGLNTSLTHVDFMVGSAELDIDGETADGKMVPLFRKGNWAG